MKSNIKAKYFHVKVKEEHTNLNVINSEVPQGSVLRSIFYFLLTILTTIAIFADDTGVIANRSIEEVNESSKERDEIDFNLHAEQKKLPETVIEWSFPSPKRGSKILRTKFEWKADMAETNLQ